MNAINNATEAMARLLNFRFNAILILSSIKHCLFNVLPRHHPCKNPFCGEQFFGRAAFGDGAAIEDDDFVGVGYRAHPVGDD